MKANSSARGDRGKNRPTMVASSASPRSMAEALENLKATVLERGMLDAPKSTQGRFDRASATRKDRRDESLASPKVPLEETPLEVVLRDLEEYLSDAEINHKVVPGSDQASVGQRDAVGLACRRRLKAIENEVEAGYSLGTWSSMHFSQLGEQQSASKICSALSNSLLCLIDGTTELEYEVIPKAQPQFDPSKINSSPGPGVQQSEEPTLSNYSQCSPLVQVWNSVQDARQGIVRQAIAARFGYIRTAPVAAMMGGAPLIVFVRERMASAPSAAELNTLIAQESRDGPEDPIDTRNVDAKSRASNDPASAWQIAALGMAVLTVVEVDNPEHMTVAVDLHLTKEVARANMAPTLVVLYVQHDSTLATACGNLRAVCNAHNVRLHVEGPAISTIVHPESPREVGGLKNSAHTFLVDAAEWLSIRGCAVATYHSSESILMNSLNPRTNSAKSSLGSDGLLESSISGSASRCLGPTTALWVFLSRVGLFQIRSLVEEACRLSHVFLTSIAAIPNLEAELTGLGSTLKISYVMSRADRLMRKYKAREQISRVNAALFTEASESARTLLMTLAYQDSQTFIVYSPSRLLMSGSFWVPDSGYVLDVIERLSAATTKYEMSTVGSPVFLKKVSNITDFEIVREEEVGPAFDLCYGAFRITPEEVKDTWRDHESELDIVQNLTGQLAEALADELEKQGVRFTNPEIGRPHQKGMSLPFAFFLHAENVDGTPDYLTVEVEEFRHSPNVVREAELAATIVLRAVSKVCQQWRGHSGVPLTVQSLGNVAGLEFYNPVPSCAPSAPEEIQPPSSRGDSSEFEAEEGRKSIDNSRLTRDDEVEAFPLKYHDENADQHPESEDSATKDGNIFLPANSQDGKRGTGASGINDYHDASAHARSHWFGSGGKKGNIRSRRNQSSRQYGNENRNEEDDDDESGAEDERYDDRDGNDESQDESPSESDASEKEEDSEEEDEDEDDGEDEYQRKRKPSSNRRGRQVDYGAESEGDDEEYEEQDGSDEEYVSASEQVRTSTSLKTDPPKQGILGWFRRNPDTSGRGNDEIESVEDEHGANGDRFQRQYDRSVDEDANGSIEADEMYEGSESEERSRRMDSDESQYSRTSDSEGPGRRPPRDARSKPQNRTPLNQDGKPAPSRFGFSWLTKKLLPAETGGSPSNLDQGAESSRSRSANNYHPSSRRSENSDSASSNSDSASSDSSRMQDSTVSMRHRRGRIDRRSHHATARRGYSSSNSMSEDELSRYSEEEEDERSVERSDSESSRQEYRSRRRREGERSNTPRPSGGVMGWFSPGQKRQQSPDSRVRSNRPRGISLSSGSSEWEPRASSNRRARKSSARSNREPSASSSLLSWLGGGARTTSEPASRSTTRRGAQRSRR